LVRHVSTHCPHCHQPLNAGSPAQQPFWRRNLTPGLGTGSLIAIALIVLMCSGGYNTGASIDRLEKRISALTEQVTELKMSLQHVAPHPAAADPKTP
jgi:hypothetical protein